MRLKRNLETEEEMQFSSRTEALGPLPSDISQSIATAGVNHAVAYWPDADSSVSGESPNAGQSFSESTTTPALAALERERERERENQGRVRREKDALAD